MVPRDGKHRCRQSLQRLLGGNEFRFVSRAYTLVKEAAEQGRTSAVRSFDRYFERKPSEEPQPVFHIPK